MLWQRSDATLVREVLGGRHEQFGMLVERHLPRVLAIAGARVRNRADADDAAQEAFLKAYTSLDTLKDHARFAPWLATIVRNVCATLHRARREEPLELTPANEPAVEPEHETRELHAVLRREIDRLEPDAREILLLHYFAGLKIREMAETLGISPSAAGKRLDRARDALGQQLVAQLGPALDLYKPREGQAKRLSAVVLAVRPPWPAVPITTAAVATSFTGITVLKALIAGVALIAAATATVQHFANSEPPQPVAQVTETVRPTTPPPSAAQPTPAGAPTQPGDPQVSGRVYDATTGQGIPGVKVTAEQPGQQPVESTPTDDRGNYAFTRLPEGRWILRRGESKMYLPGKFEAKVAVSVASDRKLSGVDFALTKGIPVRGRVVDPSGVPPAKALVHDESYGKSAIVQTDLQGRFELWLPEPGEAKLRAYSVEGPESETHRGFTHTVPGEGLDDVELVVYPLGRISGTVKNSAGQPVPGVVVNAHRHEADGYVSFPTERAVTDESGVFQIKRLFDGTYLLRIQDTDMQETALGPGQHIEDVSLTSDLPPEVNPGPPAGALTLSGRVIDPTGNPQPRSAVHCRGADESNQAAHGAAEAVKDDGSFTIAALAPGRYEVRAICTPYAPATAFASAGSSGIELKLSPERQLAGRVIRADTGAAVTGFAVARGERTRGNFEESAATVDVFPSRFATRFHDPNGRFVLSGQEVPQEDNAQLLVSAEGLATRFVPLAPNATDPGVETVIRLEPEARVEGLVLDTRGQPVAGALIVPGLAQVLGPETLKQLARAQTGDDGRFVLDRLPTYDLTLTVLHPSHTQAVVHATARSGKTTDLRITLAEGASIDVRVNRAAKPVAGATLHLYPADGSQKESGKTDPSGRYVIGGVVPGEYTLKVAMPNSPHGVDRALNVAAGLRQEITVDLQSGTGSLSGVILLPDSPTRRYRVDLTLPVSNGDVEHFVAAGGSGQAGSLPDSYRIEDLPSGQGEIEVTADGDGDLRRTRKLAVTIVDGQAQTLDFDFTGGTIAEGTVTGVRQDEMAVVLIFPAELNIGPDEPIETLEQRGSTLGRVLVEDGRFSLKGLDPGDYTLVVIAGHPETGNKGKYLSNMRKSVSQIRVEEGKATTADLELP